MWDWWGAREPGSSGTAGRLDGGVQRRWHWQSPGSRLQLQQQGEVGQQGSRAAGPGALCLRRSCRTAAGTVGNGPATAKS